MPREGHDRVFLCFDFVVAVISIHVPREGHDPYITVAVVLHAYISIHVPREGHDPGAITVVAGMTFSFQSTCPARGTTELLRASGRANYTISIHVPREGHDRVTGAAAGVHHAISIHVPREGHDPLRSLTRLPYLQFQSTCPARGTTHCIII